MNLARLLGFLVCTAVLAPAPLQAQTSPSQGDETVLVGAGVQPGPAATVGTWKVQPTGLELTRPDPEGHQLWLPTAELTDGFARLQTTLPARGTVGLVFRAQVPKGGAHELNGYGVLVDRKGLQFVRWDRGRQRPIDRKTPIDKLKIGDPIELEVWLIGPHLGVQLLDGRKLTTLGSASVTDKAFATGRVGVSLGTRGVPAPVVTRLSLRTAKVAGQARPSPAGVHRFIEVAEAVWQLLPIGLAKDLTRVEKLAGGGWIVRTSPRGAERLARAQVPLRICTDDAPFAWLDPGFIAERDRLRLNPTSGPSIDASYKDPAMIQGLLEAWQRRFPRQVQVVELGRSVQGRPILAMHWIHTDDALASRPAVLVTGATHGDELLAAEFALDVARGLLQPIDEAEAEKARKWLAGLDIWIVPLLNPDGAQAFMHVSTWGEGRKNGRRTTDEAERVIGEGVDLNRNFPFRWGALGEVGSRSRPLAEWYRGPQPGSEPETQALMRLAETQRFVASISFHTWGSAVLVPYTTNGVASPEPNQAWQVAEEVAKAAPRQSDGRHFRVKRQLYPVDGTDQDWLRATYGTIALLIEGAQHNPTSPELRKRTVAETRPAWHALFDRVLAGPRISGRVVDGLGRPVVAEVQLANDLPRNGEVWTSRPGDGRFDRLVDDRPLHEVRVLLPGRGPVTLPVTLPDGEGARVAEVVVHLP